MSKLRGPSWAIELPPEWIGEHDDICSTVCHPEGVGVLQISSYSKDGDVTLADLREFAQEHLDGGAKLADAESGDFWGFTLAFGAEGIFSQHWYLANSNKALFITYNCDEINLGSELESAKKIVASLEAT